MNMGKSYEQAKGLVKHLVATPKACALVVCAQKEDENRLRSLIWGMLPEMLNPHCTKDKIWFDLDGSRREVRFAPMRQEAVRGIAPSRIYCDSADWVREKWMGFADRHDGWDGVWAIEPTAPRAEKSPN